jgi:hypothetical protein
MQTSITGNGLLPGPEIRALQSQVISEVHRPQPQRPLPLEDISARYCT